MMRTLTQRLAAGTLLVVQFLLFGWVEGKRWMDYRKPGSQTEEGSFLGLEGQFKGQSNGYPGGLYFDPLGFSRCDIHLILDLCTVSHSSKCCMTFCIASRLAWLDHTTLKESAAAMIFQILQCATEATQQQLHDCMQHLRLHGHTVLSCLAAGQLNSQTL